MSIFILIGQFFVGLFNAAKKTYSKLSDEQKAALQQGTGLVAIINDNLTLAPAEVRALIQKAFPDLDEVKLETALFEVARSFNTTGLQDLDGAILVLQDHLTRLDGKAWAVASHAAAALLSVLFAPADTKVATIVSLIEWVYQHFIKKSTN